MAEEPPAGAQTGSVPTRSKAYQVANYMLWGGATGLVSSLAMTLLSSILAPSLLNGSVSGSSRGRSGACYSEGAAMRNDASYAPTSDKFTRAEASPSRSAVNSRGHFCSRLALASGRTSNGSLPLP